MKKSQAILEVTVVFVVGLFLFFGIMGMWMWGDNQIAKRQPEYNQSRVDAGTLKSSGSAQGGFVLEKLIEQRDDLEAQLVSMRASIEDSMAKLEASKAPWKDELLRYKAEKAFLETERSNLEAERDSLEHQLAELQRTCWGGDDCQDRIQAIQARLGVIRARIIEINDRINNFLIPEIDRLQKIVDQIDATIANLESELEETTVDLEERISELNGLIAELEDPEDPEAKDLYWPVYEPDKLTEEDVFGVQK